MDKNSEKAEIEKIKNKLEKRLFEIEKLKKEKLSKTKKNELDEDKTLFELRQELLKLQEKKASSKIQSETKNKEVKDTSKENEVQIKNIKPKETLEASTSTNSNSKVNKKENNSKKVPITTTKVITPLKNTKQKSDFSNDNKVTPKKVIIPKKQEKSKINKSSKSTIAKNKIVFIIAFIFAIIYLGYLYSLKVNLNKEKEALELKKQEQIDYSKDDAIFKEVPDDEAPEELQNIK